MRITGNDCSTTYSLFAVDLEALDSFVGNVSYESLNALYGTGWSRLEDSGTLSPTPPPVFSPNTTLNLINGYPLSQKTFSYYDHRLKFAILRMKKIFNDRKFLLAQLSMQTVNDQKFSKMEQTLFAIRKTVINPEANFSCGCLYPDYARWYVNQVEEDIREIIRLASKKD